jgi:hypothetical protein
MHGRTQHHFGGLQINMPGFAATAEQHLQPLIYFAGDFRMDRGSRLFSSGVQAWLSGWSGRFWQILSLMATSSALSFCKR